MPPLPPICSTCDVFNIRIPLSFPSTSPFACITYLYENGLDMCPAFSLLVSSFTHVSPSVSLSLFLCLSFSHMHSNQHPLAVVLPSSKMMTTVVLLFTCYASIHYNFYRAATL